VIDADSRPSLVKTQIDSVTAETIHDRERLVDSIVARWNDGESPDALRAVEQHPELARSRSLIIELACEEYWQRSERGTVESPTVFCEKFPSLKGALRRLIGLHPAVGRTGAASRSYPPLFSHYRTFLLRERLGRGAFSQVYLAADMELADRPVVLKLTTMPGDEPTALGRLEHKNIVPVHAFFPAENGDFAGLVMPFLGRATLEDVLDRLRLDLPCRQTAEIVEAVIRESKGEPGESSNAQRRSSKPFVEATLEIACGICEGLAQAHAHGFLHLDLKPSNILLAFDGTPKLLDFNLTQHIETQRLVIGGTLPYMSPEQLAIAFSEGENRTPLDQRSDIFSLGVVLYELLAGEHPFGPLDPEADVSNTVSQLNERIRRGPISLRRRHSALNPRFAALIESCLSMDRNDRPRSAAELSRRLRYELRTLPRLDRSVRRHPLLAATLAVLTACSMSGMLYAWSKIPPYADRCYAAALSAVRAGQDRDAIGQLDNCLESDPTNKPAQLLRARTLLQRGDFDRAIVDFLAVRDYAPGSARSGLIYCFASQGLPARSIGILADVGDQRDLSAADLNNLAYCHIRLVQYDVARSLLDQAVEKAPNAGIIRFNRAITDLQRALTDKNYDPSVGKADIQIAVSQIGMRGELFYFAALLSIPSGRRVAKETEDAERFLIRAIELGMTLEEAKNNPLLKRIAQRLPENLVRGNPADYSAPRIIAPTF